jgi:hypothetical protein
VAALSLFRLAGGNRKTEHHPGQESRQVPLFPELAPYLQQVFDAAEPGTEHVITRYRNTNQNLSTKLRRILRKAGVTPWENCTRTCGAPGKRN